MDPEILIAWRMRLDEIHQGQGVVRIGHGTGIAAERQPADAPMVILQELAVGFLALLFA